MAAKRIIGSVNIVIAIPGAVGNLITLISLPYARKKKLFEVNKDFEGKLMILNLCMIDMAYCFIWVFPESLSYFLNNWPFGTDCCKVSHFLSCILCSARRCSVTIIAILHCIEITRNNRWKWLTLINKSEWCNWTYKIKDPKFFWRAFKFPKIRLWNKVRLNT